MNVNIDSSESVSGTGRKYCRTCGYVDTIRGNHPETGPADICPECGPLGSGLFDSKETMIEYDHESALLRTGKPLRYLDTDTDRDADLMTDGGHPTDNTDQSNRRKSTQPHEHSFPDPIGRSTPFGSSREAIAFPQLSQIAIVVGRSCSTVIGSSDGWADNSLNRTRIRLSSYTHLLSAIFQRPYRTLLLDTDNNADLQIDGSHSIDGTGQLSSIASLKSSSSTWEKDAPPHRQPPRVPRGWISPSSVIVPAKAAPHWSQVTSRSVFSSSSDIACYYQMTPDYLDFTDLRTDGGQTELLSTTHIGESGLWIPPQLREFTGQVVVPYAAGNDPALPVWRR